MEHYAQTESPSKRRRLSLMQPASLTSFKTVPEISNPRNQEPRESLSNREKITDDDANISLPSTSKAVGQTIAPFLAEHIPGQYAPLGGSELPKNIDSNKANSKYCYRHRPDLKCRRQANEPSMEQLQQELDPLSQSDKQAIAHFWSLFSAAPSKHRNLMLQGILTQCCFPQLSYLSANVRELIRIDFLTALPPEISFRILCYLDTASLCRAAQVSQRWRTLADDDVVWHKMCEQHIDRKCTKCGWGLPLLERKRLRASKRQMQLRATGKGMNEWSPNITPFPEADIEAHPNGAKEKENTTPLGVPSNKADRLAVPTQDSSTLRGQSRELDSQGISSLENDDSYFKPRFRPWKDVYKDRFKVCTNWKYGRYSKKLFRGHTNGVMCLQFDDSILATGSYDATIKVWDIETGEELRTLRGHASGIRCLQFDDTKLISGSMDKCLKVWNWRTGECLSTYHGHSGGVIGLHFDSTILASASVDKTIKIWNFEDKSTFALRGHDDWVNAVKVDSASRTVFSASDDFTARLWDLDTRLPIRTFRGHVGQVQQVLPMPHEYEFDYGKPDHETDNEDSHSSITSNSSTQASSTFGVGFARSDRPRPPRYMLTAALDSTIRLWDVYSGQSLRIFFGHVEGIWALAADTLRVVSGAEDGMVKMWDSKSGLYEKTFTGHTGPVTCIGLSDSRLCSGGEDGEVRLYSFKSEVGFAHQDKADEGISESSGDGVSTTQSRRLMG